MNTKDNIMKRWWQVLSLLLMCFVGGSGTAWGEASFGEYCSIKHNPTVAQPWFTISVMFYDTNGKDSFFMHTPTEGNNDGPALYVDGEYVCSPDWELAWPGSGSGSSESLEKQRGNDEWWGNTYTKTNNSTGQSYKVKFWNPGKSSAGTFGVNVIIYIGKLEVGKTHTVTIKGTWRINNTSTKVEEASWTCSKLATPFSTPSAVMNDYGHMFLSGNLNTNPGGNYTTTWVGTTDNANWNNLSLVNPDALNDKKDYGMGTPSFSNLSLPFARTNFWSNQSKPVEYVLEGTVDDPDLPATEIIPVKIFQWYNISVPGFVSPKADPTFESDLWNKKITIFWEPDEGSNRSKNGTWSLYRGSTLVKSGISYDIRKWDDTSTDLAYDQSYTYNVYFVPENTPSGTAPRSELMKSVKANLNRPSDFFEKGSFTASGSTANPEAYADKIVLSWRHMRIVNASSQNYTLIVERSIDKENWDQLTTFAITDSELETGSYNDTKNLEPYTAYFYRLKINVLGKNYISDHISGSLKGMSTVTSFSASRGSYTNVVKLKWDVEQVGSITTYYTLYRRPLGSNNENDWAELTTISGTSASYSYEDATAQMGSFNEYKISVWTVVSGERKNGLEATTDGFCLSTGVIGGHITYGTGTAVQGAKVTLKRQSNDGSSGLHALKIIGNDKGLVQKSDRETIKSLFGGDFTVQAYLKPDNNATDGMNIHTGHFQFCNVPGMFDIQLKYYNVSDNNQFYIPIFYGYGGSTHRVDASQIRLPANEWSHLTVVYKRSEKKAYFYLTKDDATTVQVLDTLNIDVSKMSSTNIGITRNGNYNTINRTYRGTLDEFRLFTKALTEEEILQNYNHLLAGNEDDLAIYYPLDEGIPSQNLAYDFSKKNGMPNGRHATMAKETAGTASGTSVGSNPGELPSEKQLSLMAYTDSIGDYMISGIPFSGEGITYTIQPSLGIHEFSPVRQSRFISQQSQIHNSVDFEDVSSFPVSGTVYYAGTNYPVEGATFKVDGITCSKDGEIIKTNQEGEYEISVPIGKHFIQVVKNGHTFVDAGRYPADPNGTGEREIFNEKKTNLDFVDNTLVNFTGRVVGGSIEGEKPVGFGLSNNNIGVAEIVLTPVADYMLNVKKDNAITFSPSDTIMPVASATKEIASKSERGKGNADCKKIIIHTDPKTGEFSAMVPPILFKMDDIKVIKTGQKVGDKTTIDLTEPLLTYKDSVENEKGGYDYYEYNTMHNVPFHNTPTFTVKQEGRDDGSFGIDKYTIEDENGKLEINDIYTVNTDGSVSYKYNGALFVMEDKYTFNIEGYEEYVNEDGTTPVTDFVPLSGVVVTVANALGANQVVYGENNEDGAEPGSVRDLQSNQVQLDSLGKATYTWKAGLPNITSPFTRTITMTYDIDDRIYRWNDGKPLYGVILGSLPTGNNFVTAGPDLLDMVLRDPPGTGSSAEWTKGTVISRSKSTGGTWSSDTHVMTTTKLGATQTVGVGLGAFVLESIEAKADLEVGVHAICEGEDATTWKREVTTTRAISTSDAPEYVGAMGDVFIGSSTNIIFGLARNVDLRRVGTGQTATLSLKDAVTSGLKFGTEFAYTQNYIENVLIPNFVKMRNDKLHQVASVSGYTNTGTEPVYVTTLSPTDEKFGSSNDDKTVWGKQATLLPSDSGPSYTKVLPAGYQDSSEDSVEWCNSQIKLWQKHLYNNEKAKVEAWELRKKLGDAYGKNYSFDSGTKQTISEQTDTVTGTTYDCSVKAIVHAGITFGVGINGFGVVCDIGTETGGGKHWQEENDTTRTVTMSYTLAEEGDDDAISVDVYNYDAYGPIFRTRGGQTCNPYEGEVVTKYYQPGTTIMEATMQIEVPQIDVDVPVVSDVPTGTAANYTLRLKNASEIDEDVYYKLLVVDESNPDGAQIMIDGLTLTENRIIKIPAGETVTKALQLKQTNTSILNYENIAIVLASQTQYDPTSTWDVIADTVYISAYFVPSSSPVDLALSNTTINTETGTDLDLTFSNFDRNYHNLKAFRLQYKRPGDTDWTLLHEWVLNKKYKTNNNDTLPATGSSITYKLHMTDPDGDYLFRCESASTYGNEEVYRYSDEIALVKDMQRPTPLGIPEPSDGILDAGDEISVTFNELILKGELKKNSNFIVTGVLNGSTVEHQTALSMQDTETTAATEAAINLAGKDFSADMWVNVKGAGTILTHGSGASKIAFATDASGKLTATIGDKAYTSQKTIPTNEWVFLSMSYANTDNGGRLNATVASDASEIPLFIDENVVKYEGNGPLAVGKNLSGAIHELLLWDEAHDMTTALLNRSITKNPSTRHLIGYWKMDEGEGQTITDYARNRHMTMPAETWYLNNKNKAIALDGSHYMAINTSQINTFEDDDYALEFWMRGDKQTGEAQLVQVGDVALWTNAQGELQLTGKGAYKPADQMTNFATTSGNILDNAWHHIAVNILRQGAAAVYVDGKRVLTTNAANVGTIASDKLLLGVRRTTFSAESAEYTYGSPFKGEVDEVRVWGATMNADMIAKNRKVRLTGSEAGLMAYYPFEKDTLDNFNQPITIGIDNDLTGSGMTAQLSTLNSQLSTVNYTDEAPALRTKPTEKNVNFTYTASDTKIVIKIDEDPATIEGCTLNFTVRNVRDENGNYSLPTVWSAFVNQNRLVWDTDELIVDQPVNSSTTLTAIIKNNGGTMQSWTLNGIPAWMRASLTSGDTNPLATTKVTFTVTEATPIGKYEETIYLTGTDGIEVPLTILVTVRGEEPDWAVNESDYEGSMNLIGSLDILGVPSEDADDIVAAFIGDECRGVAHPMYNKYFDFYFLMMDIYGNGSDAGKDVTFKVYDASTGDIYPVVQTSQPVKFETNTLVGGFDTPLQLSAVDVQEQMLALSKGWTWFSLFVEPTDVTVPVVFASVADAVSIVKNQQRYLSYSDGSWLGKQFSLGNQSMYQVKMTESRNVTLTGKKVNPQEKPISLYTGWNWVAYNGGQTMSVADALADMNPQEGDYIKGQSKFATYRGGVWLGTLSSLVPGQGYMIQSVTERTFRYPKATAAANARLAFDYEELPVFFTPVDYHNYADNMTVIARVMTDGLPASGVEVGVFAGEECRAAGISNDEGLVFLTIPGDGRTQLAFRMADGNSTADCDATLEYASNAIMGTIDEPVILNAHLTGISDLNGDTAGSELYDLQGRRVYRQTEGVQRSTLKKGVYIENGQKRVKK